MFFEVQLLLLFVQPRMIRIIFVVPRYLKHLGTKNLPSLELRNDQANHCFPDLEKVELLEMPSLFRLFQFSLLSKHVPDWLCDPEILYPNYEQLNHLFNNRFGFDLSCIL